MNDPLITFLMLTDEERRLRQQTTTTSTTSTSTTLTTQIPLVKYLEIKAKQEGATSKSIYEFDKTANIIPLMYRNILCSFLDFMWDRRHHPEPPPLPPEPPQEVLPVGGFNNNNNNDDNDNDDMCLVFQDKEIFLLLLNSIISSTILWKRLKQEFRSLSDLTRSSLKCKMKIVLRMTRAGEGDDDDDDDDDDDGHNNNDNTTTTTTTKKKKKKKGTGCINFHCDNGGSSGRTTTTTTDPPRTNTTCCITATVHVALNEPTEYQGGKLCFFTNGTLDILEERPAGSVVKYQPQILHGVTAITSGTRKSLFVLDKNSSLLGTDDGRRIIPVTAEDVQTFIHHCCSSSNNTLEFASASVTTC